MPTGCDAAAVQGQRCSCAEHRSHGDGRARVAVLGSERPAVLGLGSVCLCLGHIGEHVPRNHENVVLPKHSKTGYKPPKKPSKTRFQPVNEA